MNVMNLVLIERFVDLMASSDDGMHMFRNKGFEKNIIIQASDDVDKEIEKVKQQVFELYQKICREFPNRKFTVEKVYFTFLECWLRRMIFT
jgi:hypothetical protein